MEHSFDRDFCHYCNTCNNYGDDKKCHVACSKYVAMNVLVDEHMLVNFPTNWEDIVFQELEYGKDIKKYQFLNSIAKDILNWVYEGNNLYLYSSIYGNGKTTSALKLGYRALYQIVYNQPNVVNQILHENYTPVVFLNVDTYFSRKKNSISTGSEEIIKLEERIADAVLVIWDDIGCRALTDYEFNLLYSLINERIINSRANIFTSNAIDEQLLDNIGGRLASRILDTSDIVEFTNPRQRKPRSTKRI